MLDTTEITGRLQRTLEDFIADWDLGVAVTPDTKLVDDLEFDSIDVIQLVVAIESEFENRKLGFHDLLMQDGRYVDDLSVAQIARFLEARLLLADSA
ncbi:MAG: phosphopantetheine-binding protein [Pseudomonadota bacterium]